MSSTGTCPAADSPQCTLTTETVVSVHESSHLCDASTLPDTLNTSVNSFTHQPTVESGAAPGGPGSDPRVT